MSRIYVSYKEGTDGVSQGALVCAKSDYIKYKWKRNGRLYGDEPSGTAIITSEGRKFDVPDDEEILNLYKKEAENE